MLLVLSNTVFAFADANKNAKDNSIVLNKSDLENGTLQYGITIEEEGNLVATPTSLIDFGMESYDGILTLQSWNGMTIITSIHLTSTNALMLGHSGTITIYDCEFLSVAGDERDSQQFNLRSNIPVNHFNRTFNMYVGESEKIIIKLTNLRVDRLSDGLISIPNASKRFDKVDY